VKAADIADEAVLAFLAGLPPNRWATHFSRQGWTEAERAQAMPSVHDVAPGMPEKVVRAKLGQLKKRGLVDGCGCGCRGDWHLTDAGKARTREE
jgi:hypothetical protein